MNAPVADRVVERLALRVETERLVLVPWGVGDAPDARDAIAESVNTLRPWVPWAPDHPPTSAEADALVAQWIAQREAGENLIYAVRRRADAMLVGGVGYHDRVGPRCLEIGYWVRRALAGNGYATEAAGALTRAALATDGIDELVMHIHPANRGSRRVPEKLGYTLRAGAQRTPSAPSGGDDKLLVFVLARASLAHGPASDGWMTPRR